MAGGYDRIRIDTLTDYSALRRETYDIDLAILPNSLQLSTNDNALNQRADWRIKPRKEQVSSA